MPQRETRDHEWLARVFYDRDVALGFAQAGWEELSGAYLTEAREVLALRDAAPDSERASVILHELEQGIAEAGTESAWYGFIGLEDVRWALTAQGATADAIR